VVSFSNSNNISFGMSALGSFITASVDGIKSISAGTTRATNNEVVFSNSNGVSFGMNGNTITATVTPGAAAGIAAVQAGTQTQTSGTLSFVNSNGISFGLSNSSQITANYINVASLSAGTTRATSGEVVFANSNSISFGMNGNTITAAYTIDVPALSYFDAVLMRGFVANLATGSSNGINLSFQRFSVPLGGIRVTQLDLLGHLTVVGSTAGSYSFSVGLYTFKGSTASSVSTGSVGYTFNSGTTKSGSIYGGHSGTRWRSMTIGSWSLTPGEYMLGVMMSINGPAGTTGSMTLFGGSSVSIVEALGSGAYSNYWADGIYSAGTGAFPASLHLSNINQTGASVNRQPYWRMLDTVG